MKGGVVLLGPEPARAHTAHGELDEQLVHTWDARLLWACLLLYAVLHARFVVEARRRLQRAVIALGERDSWACFQFIDTFFQPLPANHDMCRSRWTP